MPLVRPWILHEPKCLPTYPSSAGGIPQHLVSLRSGGDIIQTRGLDGPGLVTGELKALIDVHVRLCGCAALTNATPTRSTQNRDTIIQCSPRGWIFGSERPKGLCGPKTSAVGNIIRSPLPVQVHETQGGFCSLAPRTRLHIHLQVLHGTTTTVRGLPKAMRVCGLPAWSNIAHLARPNRHHPCLLLTSSEQWSPEG